MSGVEGLECEDYDDREAGLSRLGRARVQEREQPSSFARPDSRGWLSGMIRGLTVGLVLVE